MADLEEWLNTHAFHCPDISSRITPQQCESNRNAPKHVALSACKKCRSWKERIKGVGMGMSANVRAETMKALQQGSSMGEVARILGITTPALHYRIQHDEGIKDLAVERGIYKPRKKTAAPDQTNPSSIKDQFDKYTDLPNSANNISNESAQRPDTPDFAKQGPDYSKNIPDPAPGESITEDPPARTVKITIEISCDIRKLPEILKMMEG